MQGNGSGPVFWLALALGTTGATWQQPPADTPALPCGARELPKPASCPVTRHRVVIGGQPVDYDAAVGSVLITDEADQPIGNVYYFAYTKRGVVDRTRRPITFAYNGGPGSASVMVHIGALGPRRITFDSTNHPGGPPYRMVDNDYSLLDKSDLVFIDPVGTGISHLVGKGTGKDFWGVDEDARSVAQFIVKYLNASDRWNSPRYLIGESYGTTRTAVLANLMLGTYLTTFNGLVLISTALDRSTLRFDPGADLPYIMFLPSYAATAWYHRALPTQPIALAPFLAEVERFAITDYAAALLAGTAIGAAERAKVLAQLVRYTGLSAEYLDRADLRVQPGPFEKELLRSRKLITGRQDARFTGPLGNPLTDRPDYDVSSMDLFPAFLSLFNQYVRTELGFSTDATYLFHNYELPPWNSARRGAAGSRAPAGNVLLDLADVLNRSPETRVLVVSGIYDLATPYFAARWTMDHLGLSPEIRSHIRESVHESGHAVYVHEPSLIKLKRDLAELYDSTAGGKRR